MARKEPMPDRPLRLGVIGCGGFALFAVKHFLRVPGVSLGALADVSTDAARSAREQLGEGEVESVETMLRRNDIDLVYIATPPLLHGPQALAALEAGKHVITEKPLAMTLEEADAMRAAASRKERLLAVNLMQRYNPLYDKVKHLVDSRLLGRVRHGFFENYAADEKLGPGHWFWDRAKSGGIFVEHGVHFFDLFQGWLGDGEVVAAQEAARPTDPVGPGLVRRIDQVQCTVRYDPDILVNFHHGFHQPACLDRQELRLVFEKGDVTLEEWVPTRARVRAAIDRSARGSLLELFPGARETTEPPEAGADEPRRVDLSWENPSAKLDLYGELLRSFLEDQLEWIRDPGHTRRVSDRNGRDSLVVALASDRMALNTKEGPDDPAP